MNKYIVFKIVTTLWMCMTLSSCFGPVAPLQQSTYLLSAKPNNIRKHIKLHKTMLVIKTTASDAFDTTDMAYTQKPYQLAYFAKNRWIATPPDMLQSLIVSTLQGTRHFSGIASAPFTGKYDYTLSTEILDLTQNFLYRVPHLELKIRAQIVTTSSNRIVATKEFRFSEPMPYPSPYGGVIAANRAVKLFLTELAAFVLKYT